MMMDNRDKDLYVCSILVINNNNNISILGENKTLQLIDKPDKRILLQIRKKNNNNPHGIFITCDPMNISNLSSLKSCLSNIYNFNMRYSPPIIVLFTKYSENSMIFEKFC